MLVLRRCGAGHLDVGRRGLAALGVGELDAVHLRARERRGGERGEVVADVERRRRADDGHDAELERELEGRLLRRDAVARGDLLHLAAAVERGPVAGHEARRLDQEVVRQREAPVLPAPGAVRAQLRLVDPAPGPVEREELLQELRREVADADEGRDAALGEALERAPGGDVRRRQDVAPPRLVRRAPEEERARLADPDGPEPVAHGARHAVRGALRRLLRRRRLDALLRRGHVVHLDLHEEAVRRLQERHGRDGVAQRLADA
mmetsp:Transcript_29438/g.100104  ORF Transcript_29438/g.100104 Transcript_29438/m.100104 type:complete len:263 (-) Transcript_29438:467-1255(-)